MEVKMVGGNAILRKSNGSIKVMDQDGKTFKLNKKQFQKQLIDNRYSYVTGEDFALKPDNKKRNFVLGALATAVVAAGAVGIAKRGVIAQAATNLCDKTGASKVIKNVAGKAEAATEKVTEKAKVFTEKVADTTKKKASTIGSKIKKAFVAVKDFVVKIYTKVKNFFKGLFTKKPKAPKSADIGDKNAEKLMNKGRKAQHNIKQKELEETFKDFKPKSE